jgi:uracil-DNA glycosylase
MTNPSAASLALAQQLIATLPAQPVPALFNPWREHCPHQTAANGPEARLERLALHLDCRPRFILVGEAPGYQGCRYSGVAFTSERLLLEGAIPRIAPPTGRLSDRKLPFSEPSATIIWKTLYRLGIEQDVVLWNALQMHPHRPDNLWSNRTPTLDEISLGAAALQKLTRAFPEALLVAVGKKAEGLLAEMGLRAAAAVRHPANGGATQFAEGLQKLVRSREW